MNKQYLLYGGLALVVIYAISQGSDSAISNGIGTGAEFIGGGIGLLILLGGGILVVRAVL